MPLPLSDMSPHEAVHLSAFVAPPTQVIVQGTAPPVIDKIDRRSYDVKTDPDANVGVVAKLLGKLPAVTVTPDDQVALRGNSAVTVMVDGKVPAQGNDVIKSLPAADVDRIEVMTNPSAQYAPDGTAGIINIVTKKKHLAGLSGNMNGDINTFGQANAAVSANWVTSRWTLGGGLNASQYPGHGSSRSRQETRQDLLAAFDGVDQVSIFDTLSDDRQANASVAYKLTDQAGLSLRGQYGAYDSRNDSVTTYRSASGGDDFTEAVTSNFHTTFSDLDAGYDYRGKDHGDHLAVDIELKAYGNASVSRYSDPGPDPFAYSRGTYAKGWEDVVKADFDRPIGDDVLLTAGAVWDRTWRRSVQTYRGDPGDTDYSFTGTQTVSATYVTVQAPLGTWTLLPGLRVEAGHLDLPAGVTVDDVQYYPSLHLSHDLGKRSKLKLSYSRRVDRLPIDAYDPELQFSDSRTAFAGNPHLHMPTTDSFEAGVTYDTRDVSYGATLYYRVGRDTIATYTRQIAHNLLLSSLTNSDVIRSGGLEVDLSGPVSKHVKYSFNGNIYYGDRPVLAGGDGARSGQVNGSGNAMVEYDGDGGDQVQLNLSWYSRTPILFGYVSGFYETDLTWQHPLTKKLSVVVAARDLFNNASSGTVIDTGVLRQTFSSKPHDQAIKVSLAYKLGG